MAIRVVAERQPPGDRWILTEEVLEPNDEQVVLPSLPTALNEVYKRIGEKIFTVDAGKGVITVEEERDRGPKSWDLYGEHSQELLQG